MSNYRTPSVEVVYQDFVAEPPTTLEQRPATFVGNFTWGPVNKPIFVSSTDQLSQIFGKPTESNRVEWHVVADYISLTGQAFIIRAAVDTATNAILSDYRLISIHCSTIKGNFAAGDRVVIKEFNPPANGLPNIYPATDISDGVSNLYDSNTKSELVVHSIDYDKNIINIYAKYLYDGTETVPTIHVEEIIKNTRDKLIQIRSGQAPTAIGTYNKDLIIPLPVLDIEADSSPSRTFEVVPVTASYGATEISFSQLTTAYAKGSLILTSHISIDNNDEWQTKQDTIGQDLQVEGINPSTRFIARYPGALGASLGVLFVQPGFTQFSRYWTGVTKTILSGLPEIGSSQWAMDANLPELKDLCHIIVFDVDGTITGQSGTVLERFLNMSVVSGVKSDSETQFFVNSINNNSNWIYAVPGVQQSWFCQTPESQPEFRLNTTPGFFSQSQLWFPQEDAQTLSIIPRVDVHAMGYCEPASGVVSGVSWVDQNASRISDYLRKFGSDIELAVITNPSLPIINGRFEVSTTIQFNPSTMAFENAISYSNHTQPSVGSFTFSGQNYPTQKLDEFTAPVDTIKTPFWLTPNNQQTSFDVVTFGSTLRFPLKISDVSSITYLDTVGVINEWSGLVPSRDIPDLVDPAKFGTETLSAWMNVGVSGFGARKYTAPIGFTQNYLYPVVKGNGFDGVNNESALINSIDAVQEEVRIDTLLIGNLTTNTISAAANVAEKKKAVVFVSPPLSTFTGTSEQITTNLTNINIPFTRHIFVDIGWYWKFDQFIGDFIKVPLCGLTAGMADSKNFAWDTFAGQAYPNVSHVVFFPDTSSQTDKLYDVGINPIKSQNGIQLFGDRTRSPIGVLRNVLASRTINIIEKICSERAKSFLFDINNKTSSIRNTQELETILTQFTKAGAIVDFKVGVAETDKIDNQQFTFDVFLKFAETINWIIVRIVSNRISNQL